MVAKLKLPDTEFLVLSELAERKGQTEEELLAELIHEAAWREVVSQRDAKQEVEQQC